MAKMILEKVVPGKNGFAFEVKQGQSFRIIDLEGQQVADMAVFNLHNPREIWHQADRSKPSSAFAQ